METPSKPYDISRRQLLAAGAAVIAAGAFRRPIRAAASYPTTWKFGDVTVTKIVELTGPFSAARSFPEAPLDAFKENADWLVPHFYDQATQNVIFAYIIYVVRTPRQIIMFDSGYGNDKLRNDPFSNKLRGPFLEELRAPGVTPEQVNVVMNSHFGADHIGWNTRLVDGKWVPTYPKARYLFQRAEIVQFGANSPNPLDPSIVDSVNPIIDAKLADVIEGDRDLGEGLRILFRPGHTAGHQCLEINSKGQRAILLGDLFHCPIQVRYPEWSVRFDKDKELGKTQRTKFIEAYTDADVTLFASHFGGPTAGKIVTGKDGKRRFQTLVM